MKTILEIAAIMSWFGMLVGAIGWSRYTAGPIMKGKVRSPFQAAKLVPSSIKMLLLISITIFGLCMLLGIFLKA